MREYIDRLFLNEGIELTGSVRLENCKLTRKYLLDRAEISDGTCILFAIPYRSEASETPCRNISSYAVPRDYHLFVRTLSERLLPVLREKFPENRFALFADHSPIDERDAAVKCGIGSFGYNGLILNAKYSSFFFIGELVTDALLPEDMPSGDVCIKCGACRSKCPMTLEGCECLSAITQKKGELTDSEKNIIRKYMSAWGCDICQDVCPITKRAANSGSLYTRIPFFCEELTPVLKKKDVAAFSDAEFSARAFSWRGRDVILRNLSLFEKEEPKNEEKKDKGASEGK